MKVEKGHEMNAGMVQSNVETRLQGAQKDLRGLEGANFQTVKQMLSEGVKNFRDAVARKADNLQNMIPELNKIFSAYRQQAPDQQQAEQQARAFAESISKQMAESGSQASLRFDGAGGFALIVSAEARATAVNSNTIDNRSNVQNRIVIINGARETDTSSLLWQVQRRAEGEGDRFAELVKKLVPGISKKNDYRATIVQRALNGVDVRSRGRDLHVEAAVQIREARDAAIARINADAQQNKVNLFAYKSMDTSAPWGIMIDVNTDPKTQSSNNSRRI